MLLCSLADLEPNMVVGATILHPQRLDTQLLRPGMVIDNRIIKHLSRLEIQQVWVEHDATRDLDALVAPSLTNATNEVYTKMKDSIRNLSTKSISSVQVQSYQQAIKQLILEIVTIGPAAALGQQLSTVSGDLFAHCTNVAYLSVLVGLELEMYIISERSRLSTDHARDLTPLGVGAMLHDIGKVALDERVHSMHEIHLSPPDKEDPHKYYTHAEQGYEMLRNSRISAAARQIVLNHHQRMNGTGWPCIGHDDEPSNKQPKSGKEIHIFTRIVSAANTLDNLINGPNRQKRPLVMALREFQDTQYDSWFDPVIRQLMIRRMLPFPVGSLVHLNDGEKAVIFAPNTEQPCRPLVRLLEPEEHDVDGQPPIIDLSKTCKTWIAEAEGHNVEKHLFEVPAM